MIISIIMPVYNGEKWLSESIESVIGQTFKDWELIIVDDGSTDQTTNIINNYRRIEPRIKIINQEHIGRSAARNKGIVAATGDILSFIDADDVWLSSKLEKQLNFLSQNDEYNACYVLFDEIDENSQFLGSWNSFASADYMILDYVKPEVLITQGNVVAGSASSLIVYSQVLKDVGYFDPRMDAAEDLDLWYRLSIKYKIASVRETLVRIRRGPESIQRNTMRMLEGQLIFIDNIRKIGVEEHMKLALKKEYILKWGMAGCYLLKYKFVPGLRIIIWLFLHTPGWTIRSVINKFLRILGLGNQSSNV